MAETRQVEREVLSNGLVLITEAMPQVRSVAVGIWARSGSRSEPAELSGIAHFIEHMLFKGTERRTAEDIAREIERVGGYLDAFTAKEMICLNTKVLDEHLHVAFGIMADMVLRSRCSEEDVTREKNVVLEELKMEQDNPEYLVHEIFSQNLWGRHSLGRPILGTRRSVSRFTSAKTLACYREVFSLENLLITAAGSLHHSELRDMVLSEFGSLPQDRPRRRAPEAPPAPRAHITTRSKKGLEQVQLCIGVPSCPAASERRYALSVFNYVLGGGMSSRLFQNIREQQGLAYTIFSDINPYRDTGMLGVYAGTAREKTDKVIRCVIEEFHSMKAEPITEEELRRAKDHLIGSLVLSLESSTARMSNLARQELYFGRHYSTDEITRSIEALTREEIQQLARDLLQPEKIAVAVLGNLNGYRLRRSALDC
ncbi:MAG TPA: pitrilysin family protein [Candidatus Acidoferrales bacterium]|nr:pitrilysin family protein [Candidatus Acidoferrales bacterium]